MTAAATWPRWALATPFLAAAAIAAGPRLPGEGNRVSQSQTGPPRPLTAPPPRRKGCTTGNQDVSQRSPSLGTQHPCCWLSGLRATPLAWPPSRHARDLREQTTPELCAFQLGSTARRQGKGLGPLSKETLTTKASAGHSLLGFEAHHFPLLLPVAWKAAATALRPSAARLGRSFRGRAPPQGRRVSEEAGEAAGTRQMWQPAGPAAA